ncbi:MAG: radical SAM protein [Clostridia bacterium]|nr:radical SAM protein [Clostridia bacterium]
MRHINIPIFIPHMGCPNACVFCNQRKISGRTEFDIHSVESELERATKTIDYDTSEVEIAFFGGSFTGIDRGDMIYLLGLAKRYIDMGKAQSVRLSTRPDYIDGEILDILSEYGVTDIELGLQSMSDKVLLASKRGHTSEDARRACKLIKEHRFNLVGQMMIGLPESTLTDELYTAREIISMGCDAARIYPTVVFCETELCDMMQSGGYTPLTMQDAVKRSAEVLCIFAECDIPVIRLGLCAADNLFTEGTMVGGAYHSAFGELVYSELYYKKIQEYIASHGLSDKISGRDVTIYVPHGETSKASGQKRANKERLRREYGARDVKIIERDNMKKYTARVICPDR